MTVLSVLVHGHTMAWRRSVSLTRVVREQARHIAQDPAELSEQQLIVTSKGFSLGMKCRGAAKPSMLPGNDHATPKGPSAVRTYVCGVCEAGDASQPECHAGRLGRPRGSVRAAKPNQLQLL